MFWLNFSDLCRQRGKRPTRVVTDLGFAGACVTQWKNGVQPSRKSLEKLAKYFRVDTSYFFANHSKPAMQPNAVILDNLKIHLIPLFESVSAGNGELADDNIVEYIPLSFRTDAEAADTFCLRVKGNSMFPKIEDGDIVQVHRQDDAENNSIAVVIVSGANADDEGFVKKFITGTGYIELQSINPMYPPVRFTDDKMKEVTVIGVVKKIIKTL